jgi:predicted porin
MNKSLLALAVLASFAGVASAQSSVTIYGKLDLAAGKPVGTDDKQILDSAGSRLGFRGVEDLGGGLKAVFGIEHRFSPDTGAAASTFWNGYSTVGLVGAFGMVNLGRQYTPAFLMIQNQIDPFRGDTIANLRDVGMRVPGATTVRVADSIRYDLSMNGFNFGASIAETVAGGSDRPTSVAANYAAGPLFVGVGFESPTGANDEQWNLGGRYKFGFGTLSAGYTKGKNNANVNETGYVLGAVVPMGALDIKAGYAQNKIDGSAPGTGVYKKAAVGVQYNLSKRTYLFADFAKVGGVRAVGPKTGYDAGIQHNF